MYNDSKFANTSPNNTGESLDPRYPIKSTMRSSISVFFIIASFVGNALVLYALYRFRRLRTISNMIIANLSFADVLFSIVVVPINVFYWSQDAALPSAVPCHVTGVGALLFGLCSIYTLVFVSVERYFATSYPLKYRNSFGVKVVKFGLAIIWLWSVALCVIVFSVSRYTYIESFYHCIADWVDNLAFTLVMLFFGNAAPLVILIYCNTQVVRTVHKGKRIETEQRRKGSQNNSYIQRERRVSLIIIIVIVVFILCWTPYCVAMICLAVDNCTLPPEFMSAAVVLTIANGSFNPLIYGVMNRNFRAAFVAIAKPTRERQSGIIRDHGVQANNVSTIDL